MAKFIEVKGVVVSLNDFHKTWRGYHKELLGEDEATKKQQFKEHWFVSIMYTHGQDINIVCESEEDREETLKLVNKAILNYGQEG